MSATLADDSVLVSDFNADPKFVLKHITPKKASDIGDRMILIPQELNPEITDEEIKNLLISLSKQHNVVVIVPSFYRAEYWKDAATSILSTKNLHSGVDELKKGHVGLVVLVNKYDGIDLPDNACRILVIDGLPTARRKIDDIEQSILSGSDEILRRQVQRIEQGMGRGVRSNDDFCVVFLTGASLTSQLYSGGAIAKFSPAAQAQLDLSNKMAEQIQGKGLDAVKDVIKYCLNRDPQWVKVSKGALVGLEYAVEGSMNLISVKQREAFDAAVIGQFNVSVDKMQEAVNLTKDTRVLIPTLFQPKFSD